MRGRCSGVKRLLHVTFLIEELPYWLDSCQEFTKKKFDVKDAIMPVILFYLEENSIRASRFIVQISNK